MNRKIVSTLVALCLFVGLQGQAIIRANPFARAQVSSEIVIPDSVENGYYTRGWYEVGDGSSTYMTLDGSVLTAWKDLSGNSNDLVNAAGTDRPTWDSGNLEIDFDGADDYLSDGSFAYAQPITVYMVVNIISSANRDNIFRINTASNGNVNTSNVTSYIMSLVSGGVAIGTDASFYSTGSYFLLRAVFNNDVVNGSKIQVNNNTAKIGTLGVASATVFQLPTESGACPEMSVKAVIIRTVLDDATTQTAIINYLNAKYTIY